MPIKNDLVSINAPPAIFANQLDETASTKADLMPTFLVFHYFDEILRILIADGKDHSPSHRKLR